MEQIVILLEIIGTIAFASSGAMVGIYKKMDLFGVIVMAVTTAVGGGLMRDMILGNLPPAAFTDPIYVILSTVCAIVLFIVIYNRERFSDNKVFVLYEKAMTIMDAVGLGVFTILGIEKAYEQGYQNELFFLVFLGILTGVGGGVIRDVLAQKTPLIFKKHIYACASLVGALFCVLCMPFSKDIAMIGGACLVIVIRLLAVMYHWNLPKMK